ncbi:MAG: clostripain-related cysteine peptidase [Candidatus Eremiobacterota bacterium]
MNVTTSLLYSPFEAKRRVGAGEGSPAKVGAGSAPEATPAPQQAQQQAPAAQAQPPRPVVTPLEPEKEWTVLMYMNGNNGLSGQVISQMRQLEYVGSDDKINWVAQASRAPGLFDKMSKDWTGVRRYKIEHNGEKLTPSVMINEVLTSWMPGKSKGIKSPVVANLGDKNMGRPSTLEDFLEWGMQAYPAKRYMVVMMGPSAGLSGMMEDVLHGSKMKISDVGQVFDNIHQKTGKKIEVLALDGSTTSSMELAYELKDSVKYMIGSQGIQAGPGMFLAQIANELKNMNQENTQDALAMSRFWVLMNSMGTGNAAISSTISALDLSKMDGVKDAWNNLAQKILAAGISGEKLNYLLDETQDFQGMSKNLAYHNQRDAYDFAKRVFEDKDITDAAVKDAAQKAMEAIDGILVGDAAVGKFVKNAHGLSVFAPTHYGFFRPDGEPVANRSIKDADYSNTQFAQDTVWDDVLTAGAKDSSFNNALKKLGVSEGVLDGMSAFSGKHKGKVTFLGGIASLAGWFNAINAWRGAEPSGFLGIPAAYTPYVGLFGAAYDAWNAGNNTAYAVSELRDTDAIVAGGFDLARAGLKAVANLGYVNPTLKPFAATAGMLMFFSPWIRDIYGVYSNYREIRDNIELSPQPDSNRWATAVMSYVANKQLWDK